jgi:hypothetical protein
MSGRLLRIEKWETLARQAYYQPVKMGGPLLDFVAATGAFFRPALWQDAWRMEPGIEVSAGLETNHRGLLEQGGGG